MGTGKKTIAKRADISKGTASVLWNLSPGTAAGNTAGGKRRTGRGGNVPGGGGALSAVRSGGRSTLCAPACLGTTAQRHVVCGAVRGPLGGGRNPLLGGGNRLDGTWGYFDAVLPDWRSAGRCIGPGRPEKEEAENRCAVNSHKNGDIEAFRILLT